MIYLSLDTNAILDLCFRVYPEQTFPKLWEMLDDLVLTTTIKFCVCSSVLDETQSKCLSFEFDETTLEDFLVRFKVNIIDRDEVGNNILSIRTKLLTYPFSATSPHATKDEPDVDLIATAQKYHTNGYVITGEIGFIGHQWETFNARRNQRIKIPDICALIGVQSSSWLQLFQRYNFTLD
ncbi:DUF4411 family protein [Acinetobacter sp. SwsAc4]|uniref:DUF4411 family protein n=1 Tax=Acinetobacter sp. SwsAc4 TaxID=2749437 RepID=UPI0010A5E1FC|nr:DUF4411 family protein [Acinetobacter sp. SwsAc4]NWK82224.1 DUF4411 family protein [Acinetobacter sp. SwsAc4]